VIYAGSSEINVARQIEWIETCTKQHVDGIAITALDPDALAPSLKAAAAAGVKVISWDSDVQPGARKLFRLSTFSGKNGRSLRHPDGRRHELGRRMGVAVERTERP
jgi:rhamnose transport system substrate-binding protein